MSTETREIFEFLKTWGANFVSAKEICRRASTRKRFGEDANWAKPILLGMVQNGLLESDSMGRYRIKPVSQKHKSGRWVSPEIQKILERGSEVKEIQDAGMDAGENP